MGDAPAKHPPDRCPEIVNVTAAVFGGKHPETSLATRVYNIEKSLAVVKRISWATLAGVGALVVRFVGAWIEAQVHG